MKILHLVDTFELEYDRDQIQIVKMCLRRGFDTTVITSTFDSDGNLKSRSYFRDWDKQLNPVRIIRPPSFKLKLPHFRPLLVYLPHPRLFAHYDLIHMYTTGSHAFFLGNLIKRINHAKLVVRAEMSPFWHKRMKESWIWQKTILRLLKQADAVYAFTQAEKNRLLDVGIPEDKAFVVPVIIDYARLSMIRKENQDFAVGYLGRFVPFKGSHCLIQPLSNLAREFPSVKVLFAGPKTVSDYAESVIDSMSQLPNFKYLGIMPAEEFHKLTDIVVVPSLDLGKGGAETGSIATLEAMACGKAVIASNISPMNEYIEHQISGLLVNENEEFYHYCKELILNPDLRKRLGENARRKAVLFDQNKVFDKVEEMYDFAIGKTERCL